MTRYASDWEDDRSNAGDDDEPGRPSRFYEPGTPPRGWRPAGDNDVYPAPRRPSRYEPRGSRPYEGDRQDYSGRRGWRDR